MLAQEIMLATAARFILPVLLDKRESENAIQEISTICWVPGMQDD